MGKKEILELIKSRNIWYEITEHQAVFNMDDLRQVYLSYPNDDAKNLFVRDDKKQNYYLISVKGDKRVDLKEFKAKYGTRRLSFASANDLMIILKLSPGSVSPFGLLNDQDLKATFYLDEDFTKDQSIIGVHPNDNTATLWLKVEDLIEIIEEHGNEINYFKF